jgi:curli biogenesis system outer membrane secretion channel CsgG
VEYTTQTGEISSSTAARVEGALDRAVEEVSKDFPARSRLAVVYIMTPNRGTTDYITGELEHILRNRGFTIVDRSELDRVRREQRFGASGEVDDNTAASIGRIAGANIVITGRIDGEGNLRRLRLRALDATSAVVVGTASQRL